RERGNHLERWIGISNSLPRLRERTNGRVEYIVRAAARDDRIGYYACVAGERHLQLRGVERGITRDRISGRTVHDTLGAGRHAPQIGIVAQVDAGRRAVGRVEGDIAIALTL